MTQNPDASPEKTNLKPAKKKDDGRSVFSFRIPNEMLDKLTKRAKDLGMSRNELMLRILAGMPVETEADWAMVKALLKANGDMGRVGGLLKMWLSDDKRTAKFSVGMILAMIGRLETARGEIRDILREYRLRYEQPLPCPQSVKTTDSEKKADQK